jgi:hypothetical protein
LHSFSFNLALPDCDLRAMPCDFQACPRVCVFCKQASAGTAYYAEPRAHDTGEQPFSCKRITVANDSRSIHTCALQIWQQFTRQRICVDALALCKSLKSMLAEHGSELDAQEALLFEEFVN